jgi:ABC-type Na+ efflux pump permease subunit
VPNPGYWLANRDRLSQISVWVGLAAVALPLWLFAVIGTCWSKGGAPGGQAPYLVSIYTPLFFTLVFKYTVAAEATRGFCEDRQTGALELLLVTPLTVRDLLAGQKRALGSQFRAVAGIIAVLFGSEIWLSYFINEGDKSTSAVIMTGNILSLLFDFNALGWLGMWYGLRATKHHRAVLLTLFCILVIPWLFLIFAAISGLLDGQHEKMLFGLWYGLGIVSDLIWAAWARRRLFRHFRSVVAGLPVKRAGGFLIPRPGKSSAAFAS